MKTAQTGNTVFVHYTGRLNDGNVFDSSEGQEPLTFTIGSGMVIPGFDNGVLGMTIGEKKTITILCAQAYGEYREDLVFQIPIASFPEPAALEIGLPLELHNDQGHVIPVVVVEVGEVEFTVDANHGLAGQDLIFDLELVNVL